MFDNEDCHCVTFLRSSVAWFARNATRRRILRVRLDRSYIALDRDRVKVSRCFSLAASLSAVAGKPKRLVKRSGMQNRQESPTLSSELFVEPYRCGWRRGGGGEQRRGVKSERMQTSQRHSGMATRDGPSSRGIANSATQKRFRTDITGADDR